jgi:hypothetical protein
MDVSEEPAASIFRVEDGESKFLQNFGNNLPDCMVSDNRTY